MAVKLQKAEKIAKDAQCDRNKEKESGEERRMELDKALDEIQALKLQIRNEIGLHQVIELETRLW